MFFKRHNEFSSILIQLFFLIKIIKFAYMNVIDYYKLWKNTTTKYKIFVLKKLIKYTIKETNQKYVDKKYWPIYKKFNIEYKIR